MASSSTSHIRAATKCPQKLCDKCQLVVNQLDSIDSETSEPNVAGVYNNALMIQFNAENGCLLCGQILWIVESQTLKNPSPLEDINLLLSIQKPGMDRVIIGSYFSSTQIVSGNFVILAFRERGEDAEMGFVEVKKNSRDALPLVDRWLQSCCTTHNICGSGLTSRSLPSRLIYTKGIPRLCLAINVESSPKYATLSHCWGNLKTLTLLRGNLESFTSRIPSAALTLTITDAIQVAQDLGIDYIWVDSLCIIQDSPDDWLSESANMSEVYGNSYLNIAATGAADGSHGLFHLQKEYRNQSFVASPSTYGRIEVLYHFVPDILYRQSMLEAPLNQRAWVIQERLLSKRTIHFTSSQVFWECSENTACEVFRQQIPPRFFSDVSSQTSFRKRSLQDYRWEEIVWLYTRCNLTFDRDKLPAISGVAQQMAKLKQRPYIFGLLQDESFPLQLCWTRNHLVSGKIRRPEGYRAPSWSWAAVNCPVTYDGTSIKLRDQPSVKIDSYIEIQHGQHEIAGSSSSQIDSNAFLQINCSSLLQIVHNKDADDATTREHWYLQQWIIDGLAVMASATSDCPYEPHNDFYLLLVSKVVFDQAPRNRQVDCLILQKTGRKKGQYRRLGYLRLDIRRFNEAPCYDEELFYQRLEADSLGKQDPLKPEDYVKDLREEESKFMYQIELV